MNKISIAIVLGLLVPLTILVNTAYANSEPDGDDTTLVVSQLTTPKLLYGGVMSGQAVAVPSTQLFASPVRYTDNFEPKPYLAKSWEFSDDGRTLTLHLVHDATFTDGKPVTAVDVKYSIHVVKKYHPFGAQIWGNLKSIETPDPYTVVIHFSAPSPAAMIGLSPGLLPVLPKHVYGQYENLKAHLSRNIVGSGPYKLVSFEVGQQIVLKGRDDFFLEGLPKTDRLILHFFNNETTAEIAMARGVVDLAYFANPAVLKQARKDGLVLEEQGYEAVGMIVWLEFNTKRKYLKKRKVRQALAYATNVEFLIQELQNGFSKQVFSPIAPASPFYNPNGPKYPYNPAKARKLLNQAGFPPDESGTRFTLHITYIPVSAPYFGSVARALKSMWAKVGVNLIVDAPPDEPTWATQVANYNYDVSIDTVWNWGDPAIGVARSYLCSNIHKGVVWTNMTRYCNPKVDKLFKAAATEADFEQRKKLYFKVQEILMRDLPIYPLMTWGLTIVHSKKVSHAPNGIWGMMAPLLKTTVSE